MNKSIFSLIVSLGLILSACSSPAPTATQAPVPTDVPEQPTATLAPTERPTEVPPTSTPEPTATPVPEPLPITAANIAGLSKTGAIEIPRQPNLVTDPNLSGIVGGYTPDSQHIVLRTDVGVDILSATTLEVEKQYPGLRLVNIMSDGRFAALQNDRLVLVEPNSGEMETVETEADLSGTFAVSPTGEQIASAMGDEVVRLYSLTGGEPIDIPLVKREVPMLLFSPDGVSLVLDFSNFSDFHSEVYDTSNGTLRYSHQSYPGPSFSADGKYIVEKTLANGYSVNDSLTGDVINAVEQGHKLEEGCDATTCVLHYQNIAAYFVGGGPESVLAFWNEYYSTYPVGGFITQDPKVTELPSILTNFLTGAQIASFSNYSQSNLVAGFGAGDGSAFLLVKNTGELFLHNSKDGNLLTQTDRYSIGGPARLSPDGAQVGWSNVKGVYAYDWQAAKSVLEQSQPFPLSYSTLVGFLPEGRLLVESTSGGGVGLDVWNIANGTIETTLTALGDCSADAVGAYVLCTVPSSGSRRILAMDNPDRIVFATNDPNITVISPTGDSYSTCKPGGSSITYKNYESGNVTIAQPCQPMFYNSDGTLLVLQSGVVVNLPSGESTLTLEADANGQAFSGESPAAFFGPDFIIVGNRAFDAASGKLLGELPASGALGFTLSEDGFTLNVLTGAGMEQWQVLN